MPEVQSPAFTEFNVRQDQGRPCFIRLHDSVVKDLERLLMLGGEQPGILLGTVEVSDTCTITVEDSEPTAKVEDRIRTWRPRAGSSQKVVGCYTSHSRPEFGLDQADRAMFQRCFPKDERLLLQVKPPKGGAGTAMFFLGDSGQLAEDKATVEFPFNLRELGAEEPPAVIDPVRQAAAAPPAPPAPGPAKGGTGIFWKLAVACVAVVASVVGLNGLRVFDGQNAPSQPVQPVAQQPAPVAQPAAANPPTVPDPPKPAPPKVVKATPEPEPVPKPKTVIFRQPAPASPTLVAENPISRPVVPAPPVTQTAPPPASVVQPRAVTPVTPAPPPPPVATPAVQTPKAVQPAAPLTPPRVIRQSAPEVQDSVRRMIVGDVVVKIRANVNATGRVIAAESVSKGNPIAESLAGSAIAAVKRWQFEPAQRGDEKVPGDIVLSFTFRK